MVIFVLPPPISTGGGDEQEHTRRRQQLIRFFKTTTTELVVTGSRSIAPGERIFASRMFGAKGYMVTFEQIDPLFTIDSSDHSNPTLVGELKILGYFPDLCSR